MNNTKIFSTIFAAIIASSAAASVKYMSPTEPTAFPMLAPGDTLLFLPGVYHPDISQIMCTATPGPYAVVYNLNMSGEPDKPIVIKGIMDDEGNRPVIDFSNVTYRDDEYPEGYRITGFLITGSYLLLSDLECVGLQVTRTDHTQSENFRISDGAYNILENISCHDGMGIGFYIINDSHHNVVINCDAYNNYDPVSDISRRTGEGSGGNNDGFGCHVKGGMEGNAFIGCRAWRNSDDGFDLINCYSPADISYCIAIENGFDAQGNNRADGNGVKAGGFGMKPRDIPLFNGESPRHVISNNVAAANKANGIYANHHLGGIEFSHNTSIAHGKSNFSLINRKGPQKDNNVDVEGYGHSLSGNLSLSPVANHILWSKSIPADNEIYCNSESMDPDLNLLMAPRLKDGRLAPETIEYINSLIQDGKGADFSGYDDCATNAKKLIAH